MNYTIKKIAGSLYKIRHWKIVHDDYRNVQNEKATWFIDPPYQFGGHCYVHSNKKIDFAELASWSRDRTGQVIVCEGQKADWLDFVPVATQKCRGKGFITEMIWTNEKTDLTNKQAQLFQ